MIRKGIISKMLFSGAALLVLASCSESYPGIDYDKTQGNKGIENQEGGDKENVPVMVFVNEQNIFAVKTRGVGPFEPADRYNEERLSNSTFYVYAFRDGNYDKGPEELRRPTDYTYSRWNAPNVSGHAIDYDNMHCLLDGQNYSEGWPMALHPHGSGRFEYKGDLETPYYSRTYPGVPYNFFAYYWDDITPKAVHRTADGISYDIEIDGSQDLMCGYAPNLKEEIDKGFDSRYYDIWNSLTSDEKRAILNAGGYCAQAANHGIHPSVDIKHCLTQLTFTAYPGNESSSRVTIEGVTVKSKYKGTFTVAATDLSKIGMHFDSQRTNMELREPSDGVNPQEPLKNYTAPYEDWMKPLEWYERPHVEVGSSLMVAPDEEYTLVIHCVEEKPHEIGGAPEIIRSSPTYTLHSPGESGVFEAGYTYNISIAIYGTQQIMVYANVQGWKPGGTVFKDDPEDN